MGGNATEIFKMFEVAFGEQTLGTTQFPHPPPPPPPPTKFKSGLTSGESDKHSKHPLISK
jgi:hypothetical protein